MRTLFLAIAVAACSGHSGNGPTTDGALPGGDAEGSGSNDGSGSGSGMSSKATIFTILFENHDYKEIVSKTVDPMGGGSAAGSNAPYINSLIPMYGLATNYKDTGHPSTPNYLHLISGSNQYPGIFDVGPTFSLYFPSSAENLATQLEAANIEWRSYSENVGSAGCGLNDAGEYVPRHDPFVYFSDQQLGSNSLCAHTNVDYSQFAADLASNNYRYMWITPNLIDDGHDPATDPVGALKTSDTWLSQNLPAILASDGYKNGGVVFITWDEAEGRNGDDTDLIPMIVISPRLKHAGITTATALDHSAYLATVEDLLGLPRLPTVSSSPTLMDLLN
jgi:hypothetical protein